ncbi:DUF1993 domain-containing protein [Candidatus Kaiserbacteria bacterium]|nr:DUF1993 domain-containing protein [Candidatus Kaiserbacteria bacterium]
METNLYTVTVPVMQKTLTALDKMLDKVAAHTETLANERRPASYYENAILQSRLVFDQFPLVQQVQVACDNAKNGAARLAEVEAPKMEDNETTIAELKSRIAKTLEFLKTIKQADIDGKEDIRVTLPYWGGKYLTGFEYATEYLMPNFFFHYTTAYSILRSNGIQIGKSDYSGGLPLKDL